MLKLAARQCASAARRQGRGLLAAARRGLASEVQSDSEAPSLHGDLTPEQVPCAPSAARRSICSCAESRHAPSARQSACSHVCPRSAAGGCRAAGPAPMPLASLLLSPQVEFKNVAEAFAREEMLPFSAAWDRDHHFPVRKS